MSDKLAISATLSVLMMTAYVLFGGEAAHVPFGPDSLEAPAGISAPSFDVEVLLPGSLR